ncbi:DUF4871 domain-containing protein [Aneurinibacillus tyrosinisolvens]|uniref:DUF4871 domain-containing protein n=1 Tax=Aneurinibacillus tyrosinisolvens TaxID=1443435 RepID=UPI00069CAE95|nr:DUF4871 domain-containing protein [Aneurinibacillus tyrosinisolvens]
MKNVAVILIVFMMVAGCSNGEQSKGNENSKTVASSKTTNEWKVSPAFMVKDPKRPNSPIEMFGKEGKIGIIGPQLYANNGQKWMWHFWGDKNTLNSGKLKVEATNKHTDEKVPALIMDGGTANEHKVWEYAGVGGSNNGADAHMPSNISLPKPGLWRLDVYIGDRLFGNIVIEVKSASQSNSETDWKLRPAYREGDKLLFSFGFSDKNPNIRTI